MSDPVENDNTNPDVDNLASLTTESHTIVCEAELDDDFFVCRKCNKVFKDLSEYLEHKIRDENYKLSHTRSKLCKRMVIPQLVEKNKAVSKSNNLRDVNTSNNNNGTNESDGANDNKDDSTNPSSMNAPTTTVKRGRKRKAETENRVHEPLPVLGKDNNCHLCDQKFRRAATLRWHLKYDHKEKEDNSEDSDTSVDGMVTAEMDEDFQPGVKQENEESKDGESNVDPDPIISQPKITVLSARKNKKQDAKDDSFHQVDDAGDQRPYVCDVCGRGFKELPVYKAHAIVHSNERNFVCTVEGCPYGFKTKGCLVRHMRRHTGERPYSCEKCGRAFAESGALNRHLKARRNCAQTPDTHYPRYKKKWSYHPNIEAVVDQAQRDVHIADQEQIDTKFFIHRESVHLAELAGDGIKTENPITLVSETEKAGVITSEIIISEWPLTDERPIDNADKNLISPAEPSIASGSGILEQKTVDSFTELHCQVCNKEFQQIELLETHLRTHLADQPTHCRLCHFLAHSRDEMRKHVLTMHTESLNDIESTVFSVEQINQNDNASQQKDERTALREALQAIKQLHKLKTSNEKSSSLVVNPSTTGSLQCMICNRSFKGANYMRQHMRMHTGDRPYKCPQCNSSFTSKDVMKKHMYVHMNQRDYKCGECGKMFKRLVHVQQHIKTHSQERSFRCSVCEKLFKTHNSLKVHLRTHTNINPYRCQVCNRHFRERGSLQRHTRLHTGEKPYVCPHCNRGFAEQGTLSRHLKAKVPCSSTRDNIQLGPPNSTMLAQFSSMVADTQYILPSVNNEELTSGNLIVLKTGESEEVIENIEVVTEESALDGKLQSENPVISESIDQMMDENNTETLQVYDPSTGESLIITGDKSVMEIVKSQQVALESMNGGLNLDKIRDILMAAGESQTVATPADGLIGEHESTVVINEEMVETNDGQEITEKLEIDISEGNIQVADLGTEI